MASYLQVENISKSYGDRTLFKNVSFNINEGDKIALIAPNGTGKTTLLSILAGKDSSDMGGEVKFLKDIKVHFLEQDQLYDPDSTIFDILYNGADDVSAAIRQYEQAVASGDMHRIGNAMNLMDSLQAWKIEQDIKSSLSSLGIEDCSKKVSVLSGGERKRVAIAAMILSKADFLVLDEPTNHLDLDTIEFLEDYLGKSRCTLLMVTHDRYFLDRVCNHIIELDKDGIYNYSGNYSYFLEKKQEREDMRAAEIKRAKNLYRTELDWMRRMPCARGTKAKYRVDAFHVLKGKAFDNAASARSMEIDSGMARVGKKIIECRNATYSYGDKLILDGFTYNFARGEKIGVIGPNGIGKSMFIKLLIGELKPDSGTISVGETIRFGYYSQAGMSFNPDQTVMEAVRDIAETVRLSDGSVVSVTSFLGKFLFPPSSYNVKIGKLSGGERRRLYLLTVLMRNPNFLVLDEPTNDLDILTLNILEDYLVSFEGPVLVVSHDRYFMDKIADHIFVFTGGGEVRDFPGSYTDFRNFMEANGLKDYGTAMSAHSGVDTGRAGNASSSKSTNQKGKNRSFNENGAGRPSVRKLSYKEKREIEELEAEIAALEAEKKEIEEKLSSGLLSAKELNEASLRYSECSAVLDEKETRWLELSEAGTF